ncbi:2-hydroxychromene-2-carboxylate isomerase/DsbA-like thioredoxin domain protein [Rubellimicrobium mesophilum DSM 19309]|uniref:2-hydroxychromene-2-carboxylate isomerase/DsbA-like thioredoxin domain protein n=1 Tax=Rubellimicrobium mesophilum DSM 19309 TaxID=442562 RepID=A0A017HKE5_9RHOB|nr:DsbA family oxidoreductase [Rubellimicrobium mesophilum]EYD74962.1 2-hydroxychromene-2-carboxylate isomerase/DsbA-like thioredoxin domain protein [Rubellimicrobium mesophilum DSM 19309]
MSPRTPSIKIDVWSDVACPWCYLGKKRLDVALDAYARTPEAWPVEVAYHSYQLNPDLPADYEGGHSEYLASRLGMSPEQIQASNQRLSEMGADVGADYRMDRVVISNTLKAHELLHVAKAQGQQAEMKERLLRAYWSEGRRLGCTDELVDLAAEVGLDGPAAREALETGAYRGAVRADLAQAAQYGIRGVPFFVLDGKYGLSGAQKPETLLQALTSVAGEARRAG